MKICFIANVDFAMRHFILPLMRGARARGHEVVGLCAEGPLLDIPRAEGFRIEAMPMARSMNPLLQWNAYKAVRDFLKRENCDLVHAHMPISGLIGRAAARSAGVPRIAYTCHGFLFNQPGPWWRRTLALQLERVAGRITDVYLTVSEEEAADASNASAAQSGLALAAATADTAAGSLKNFRHHPDIENFYRFIFENDLRYEALEFIDVIASQRGALETIKKTLKAGKSKH
jgi:hypothetical protein